MAPCASSRLGSRPASISARTRAMTPKPWCRSSMHAGDARSQHQADRRQRADLAADDDEAGDFQQRQRKQEERKQRNAQVVTESFPMFCRPASNRRWH